MRWSDIKFRPSSQLLRQFAMLWIGFFLCLAAWQGWGHDRSSLGIAFVVLALTVGPVGMWRPQWIRPIYVGWTIAAFPIGWTVSHLLLGLMFYGLFTPVALVFRLMRRDVLQRHKPANATTYWQPKPVPADVSNYFRQF